MLLHQKDLEQPPKTTNRCKSAVRKRRCTSEKSSDAIWKLVWRTKQTKTKKRNKPHINRVKTLMQARYVTGVYRSKIKWRRQSPALLNPQLRFPHFAGDCDGTKRWYQTSSTSTRENQRKPTQQTPRQRSESQDFQTLNLWHRPDMHAMTGVSRCGIAPGRRKRKQGNIKPRLKHSAALPTLCGRMWWN